MKVKRNGIYEYATNELLRKEWKKSLPLDGKLVGEIEVDFGAWSEWIKENLWEMIERAGGVIYRS